MTFLEACRAWKHVHGQLPGKLTIFLEGEEESGSPSLVPFLRDHKAELSADLALICDTGLFEGAVPAITTMLRGLAKAEFTLHAASRDLHSGMYGGLARNPLHVMAKLLSGLHDDTGRVNHSGLLRRRGRPARCLARPMAVAGLRPCPLSGRRGPVGARGRTGPHAAGDDLVAPPRPR